MATRSTAVRALLVLFALILVTTACEEPRLVSSDGTFGNDLFGDLNGNGVANPGDCIDPFAACAGAQPFHWASINSPFFARSNGDPYSARCLAGTTCDAATNPEFRPGGYRFAIDVAQPGQVVTVQLYDAPAYYQAGSLGDWGSFRTQYELFAEDGTAATPTTAELSMAGGCTFGPGRRSFPGQFQPATYRHRWFTLCHFTASAAGVYPLEVRVSDLTADPSTGAAACTICIESTINDAVRPGWNSFSVKAVAASGPQPTVSALGDASLYAVVDASSLSIPLVEVPSSKAGHQLVVDLFDAGDVVGTANQIRLVNGAGSTVPTCSLAIGAVQSTRLDPPTATETFTDGCTFPTRTAEGSFRFDGRWIRLTTTIPPTHACSGDCWWSIGYESTNNTVAERLTLRAGFVAPQ